VIIITRRIDGGVLEKLIPWGN